MVQMLFLMALSILAFSGCSEKECKPIVETHYIERNVTKPVEKPTGLEIHPVILKFNEKTYYALTPEEAKVLLSNWYGYQNFGETNYGILKLESSPK